LNPALSTSRSRAPVLLAVLLLHLAAGTLMLRDARQLPVAATPGRTELRLLPVQPPPLPAVAAAVPRAMQAQSRAVPGPNAISLPALPAIAIDTEALTTQPAHQPSLPASAPAPLDLRLPARVGARPAPSLADQIRADGRANSPRESAAERMANALGAKGWTVVELSDGGRKVTGPFGECQIIRPSMVDAIPGHPHAGLLPPRVFGCGGIEKGSLKHERPK
jgi:hypothetical protein